MAWKWNADPFSPERAAEQLIKVKFGGAIPPAIAPDECVDLMLAFTLYETSRAEALAQLMMSWPSQKRVTPPDKI
jgi:hypothetical protein